MDKNFDKKYIINNNIKLLVGCDEAGRGCLAGPVVAAAVILKDDFYDDLIDDSKKLTPNQREKAYQMIINNCICYGVGIISSETIDKINIYEASRQAMLLAIKNMKHDFDLVLTDAMKLHDEHIRCIDIIKGDAKSFSIASASIIAKVTRDHIMDELDKLYPQYQFKKHKGYGTKLHLQCLEKYGPLKGIHRFSYKPVKKIIDPIIKLF